VLFVDESVSNQIDHHVDRLNCIEVIMTGFKIKVVLIDAEPLANEHLQFLLTMHPEVRVVASEKSGMAGARAVLRERPNIVFIDQDVPGFADIGPVAKHPMKKIPFFVVTVRTPTEAMSAFERGAFDCLLKPIPRERLMICLDRLRPSVALDMRNSELENEVGQPESLSCEPHGAVKEKQSSFTADGASPFKLYEGGREKKFNSKDLVWISAERDYIRLHFTQSEALIRGTMQDMSERLSTLRFNRIHRSAIVNMDRVRKREWTETGALVVILDDGTRVRVGRKYIGDLLALFGRSGYRKPDRVLRGQGIEFGPK
jgi:two-component system, LytTR family, response regulator